MDAFFAAVDVTGLSTGVTTILLALVGVALLFTGYKYTRKALNG